MERDARTRDPETVMGTTLFIGPYYGEFGHELGFAAMARAEAKKYPHVVVSTRPERHALYADFATEFCPHDIECVGMCEGATAETAPSGHALGRWVPCEEGIDVFQPVRFHPKHPHEYVSYGRHSNGWADAIVFHARWRPHVPTRNWPQAHWHALARRILKKGWASRIACIGTPEQALTAEGAADLRGLPLTAQMDVLASAKMIIGPSSGPLHLATLCCGKRKHGCPQVVWCGGGASERRITSGRYRGGWNPFATPVDAFQYASWQPNLETVWDHVLLFWNELGGKA